MKRKILIPTDFSRNSWNALEYALQLYKEDNCVFYILNVFSATENIMDNLINFEPGSELFEIAKSKSENGLKRVLDLLEVEGYNKNQNHRFETISTFNYPLEGIKNMVEKKDIEMIVMGTKGETDSRHTAFGSIAIYVMEKVRNCPVIVVPDKAKQTLPKQIVFPTSYKTHYKRRELSYLTEIAEKCNAKIEVLHVCIEDQLDANQEEHKEMLKEIFEDIPHSFYELSYNSVEAAINIFVESRESGMIAFINKKHTFFGSILSQPLVKEVGFHSKVPVLVMHDLRN